MALPPGEVCSFTLDAPIEKVAKVLAKHLKPGRQIVSAVKFADGSMSELRGPVIEVEAGLYRDPAPPPQAPQGPKAGTSVALPTLGCPAPDFPAAELKAREVLRHFLTPEQVEDFNRYNRFITVGATTGHRYMVTSRFARDSLAAYQRSLYDLDDRTPFCVHDWMVPPAEEMLALHILLQLPGHENYLRHLEN